MKHKFEKLKDFTSSKAFLVIFSIACGIVAWLFVLDNNNPEIERTITVEPQFINFEEPAKKDLTLVSDLGVLAAEIKISGREDIVNNVTPADLTLSVDFSQIEKTGASYIRIDSPKCDKLGVKIEDYYPKEIAVTYDTRMEIYLPVRVDFSNALLKSGYEIISVTSEPDNVPISGFASVIENLEYISVDLSRSIVDGSVSGDKTLRLIGRFISNTGNDVTANHETEKISVQLDVAKRVPIKYSITGEPKDDFYFVTSGLDFGSVLVDGNNSDLAQLNEINLGYVNIADSSESMTFEFNVNDYLPDSLRAVETSKVSLDVEIAQYATKSFLVSPDEISYSGRYDDSYVYSINFNQRIIDEDGAISITVKGKSEDVEKVTLSSLKPTLSLAEDVGDYRMQPVELTLPENVELVNEGEYWANINIRPIPTPEPTLAPTEAPTEAPPTSSEVPAIPSPEPTDSV